MTNLRENGLNKLVSNKDLQEQKKKDKKKIHIKNTIISILSHQPRKLMKLAKKSAYQLKNSDNQLIPKLSLKNLYPEIDLMQKINEQKKKEFESMNNELTTSMLFFHKNITNLPNEQQGKILSIQVQKCYKHIPQYFFKQLSFNEITKLLTRNKKQVQQTIYDLIDYSDEIEYNINQQVNYKMKIFIQFVSYLNGIGHLVDISSQKMRGARNQNKIVRQIIVQKSININLLRIKQDNLRKTIGFLQQIKKVKQIQKSLMSIIHAKAKMTVCQLYETYILQHLKIKQVCCKHHLCNFSDIKYFVQRNYHQKFNKALQRYDFVYIFSYLGEIVKLQKDKIKQIFHPKKSTFISTPHSIRQNFSHNKVYQGGNKNQKQNMFLDESIQVEDQFQLIIKSNIQKQILHIFKMGVQKCTYSTDSLCEFMKQELQKIQLQFYQLLYQNSKKKQDVLQNFINFTLNKPTLTSLQISIQNKNLSIDSRGQICNKIALIKFIGAIQIYSKNLQNICIRANSIINQLLKLLKPLQKISPQKYQIVVTYLIQIVMIIISFSKNSLSCLIFIRQIKQNQINISDKLINLCKGWESFIYQFEEKYPQLWRKLSYHIFITSDSQCKMVTLQNKDSFNSLKNFVQQNFQSEGEEDVSMDFIQKQQTVTILIQNIIYAKNWLISINFSNYSKQVINKQIIKQFEVQSFTPVNISQLTQDHINYILYGRQHGQNQKQKVDDHKYLSNSLLLDKSNIKITLKGQEQLRNKNSQQSIKQPQNLYNFSSNQQKLTFHNLHFKLIKSIQFAIQALYNLFLYFDQFTIIKTNQNTQKDKQIKLLNIYSSKNMTQIHSLTIQILFAKISQIFLLFYTQIKNLLLNLNNLKNKVKSFAKFFVLIFSQVQLLKTFSTIIFNNSNRFSKKNEYKNRKQLNDMKNNIQSNLQNLMNQIGKKYSETIIVKIKESIKKLQVNLKKPITCPSESTLQIISTLSKSASLFEEHFIAENKLELFLGFSWANLYIQKLKDQQRIIQKSIMKSTESNSNGMAGKMQQMNWEQKNNWILKQLQYFWMQVESQIYFKYIKDINLISNQLIALKKKSK